MKVQILTDDGAKAIVWKLKKVIEHIESNPDFYDKRRNTGGYSILFNDNDVVREQGLITINLNMKRYDSGKT